MWLLDDSPEMVKIYGELYRIGIFANYKGFFYTARSQSGCIRRWQPTTTPAGRQWKEASGQ